MALSVIIPAYRDLKAVLRALNSVQATATGAHEYIVQDDCPEDTLLPYIPPCVASVEVNKSNLGFGGNCNAGAQRAGGDILLFLNQDAYAVYGLSEAWDEAILRAFDNPKVGVVGVRLLFPDGRIQHAGVHFDGNCQPTHRFLGYADKDYRRAIVPEQVPAVTGAALAIRAPLFHKLGGFDAESYPGGYFEDVDLCARVVREGACIWYEPRCTFIHEVGTSGGNPLFAQNARTFKERWVDTGHIEPDTTAVRERFW